MKKIFCIISLIVIMLCGYVLIVKSQTVKDTIVKLKEVEVKGTFSKPYVISKIDNIQLQEQNVRDIGDQLRSVPNVSGLRKGGSCIDPVVRGFRFNQINVLLNSGVRIEGGCPSRMDPVTSHIEAEDIESIEIIKGPYLLKYGPSLGGVINLITTQPQYNDTFSIHAKALYGFESNWNGQREHLSVYGGNKKVWFNAAGGYKDYGNYEDGNDNTVKSSFMKYNYSGNLGFCFNKHHSVLFTYYETHGRDVLYPALPMDEASDNTRIMSVDYNVKNISKIINGITIKLFNTSVEHVMDNSKRANYSTMEAVSAVDAISTGGKIGMGLNIGKHILNIGTGYEQIYKDGAKTMTMFMMGTKSVKKANLWYDGMIQNVGLFAEYQTKIKSFDINATVRGDLNHADSNDTLLIVKEGVDYFADNSSQHKNISFSFLISRNVTKNISVGLALGRGVRSSNMLERYIKFMTVGYDNYDYLGNPQLKPEANHQVDLTVKYTCEKIGNIYVNGFYSYVTDFITGKKLPPTVAMPKTQGALGVKQFVNVDCVNLQGFEVGYQSPDNYKFGSSLIAAYTQATFPTMTKYIITNNQITGEETITNDPLPEIPPIESTVTVYYKLLKKKLVPKISCRVIGEQKRVSSAFYEPSTPSFVLLNFSVVYKPFKNTTVSAGIDNIFNKPYYEHLNRKIVGTTTKLYEPGRIFFINLIITI